MRRIIPYCIGLFLWLPGNLNAQRVIYSESFNTRNTGRVQVVGKSENYYWVEKLQKQKLNRQRGSEVVYELKSFELFDVRLNLVKEIPATHIAGTLKQWLLAGKKGMDQVMLLSSSGKTSIYCRRFWCKDTVENQTMLVGNLPFSTGVSRFLLVRSEDQSKILLLAFENTDTESSRLYAILFDSDWNPIYQQDNFTYTIFTALHPG